MWGGRGSIALVSATYRSDKQLRGDPWIPAGPASLVPPGRCRLLPVREGPGLDKSGPAVPIALRLVLAALAAFLGSAAGAGVAPTDPEPAGEATAAAGTETKADRARREVAALVAKFHARMPRGDAIAVGAAYAQYSSRFQDSVAN